MLCYKTLQNSGATFDFVPDNKIAVVGAGGLYYRDIPTSSNTLGIAVLRFVVKCKDVNYYHNNNNGTAPVCSYVDKDNNVIASVSSYNNNYPIDKSYIYFTGGTSASNSRPNAVWFT